MGDTSLFEAIVMLLHILKEKMWHLVALIFDVTRHISALGSGMLVVGLCLAVTGIAFAMQWRLTKTLTDDPKASVSLIRQEISFSLPVIVMFIIALPALIVVWAVRAAVDLVKSLIISGGKPPDKKAKEKDVSVVVASLGPSFMWAGLIVAGIYLAAWAIEPLLRYQLDLSDGYPAWQYLILGARPELQWYLPLERFPYLGALCAIALWGTLWWWTGRIVRIVLASDLGNNLADKLDNSQVLASWRTWFGARELFQPDDSYKRWAKWLPLAAVPFLVWAWASISAKPYRMGSSMFAVSVVLWLSWALHLNLRGHWHIADNTPEPEPKPEPEEGKGWADVLDDLQKRLQVAEPYTFDAPRVVEALEAASRAPRHGLISPLLSEVLPDDAGFTPMQQAVLETLSHQAYVHVDPPSELGELELRRVSGAGIEDESGFRHRNQIVLAPGGSGKTTLAMLAACNHALVHTRSTLVVTRDGRAAERFAELLRSKLEPSTLRWTVRVRTAGTSLVNDLSQGIIPDVLVTSLRQLVVGILDKPRTYAPFLKTLGLIIVDDVESYCGPVEIHMQLAFRRLTLRVRELLGIHQLGEESAPVTLILGADSMHDTPTWVKTLCGIDGVTRVFDYGNGRGPIERVEPEESDDAADTDDAESTDESASSTGGSGQGLSALQDAVPGRYHLFYHLSDFVSESGAAVSVHDLIESCERLSIPWHWRTCGDEHRRHTRRNLKLAQEPQHEVESPLDACVVFLAGNVSTVRREIEHLSRAGLRYEPVAGQEKLARPVPIAFVSVVNPDERMALTELNPHSSLADVVRTLPRPVVRAPFGRAVEVHLASDLADTWTEVADILDVFGNATVHTLARLADSGLLVYESRTDLDDDATGYEKNLYVRVPSKAVASSEDALERDGNVALLPPRVSQVERPPGRTVAIRDRTNLTVIEQTDRVSARHVYYPGRIFETVQGRYVVVGVASDTGESGDKGPVSEHDILVEPFLNDDISSPRRRARFRTLDAAELLPGELDTAEESTPKSKRNSKTSLTVEESTPKSKRSSKNSPGVHSGVPKRIDAEPVFIGDYPVAVSLGPVECQTTHLATFRLDPHSFQVRQRIVFAGRDAHRTAPSTDSVRTMALGIFPNPDLDVVHEDGTPRLELRDARLIAAAMRAVLPSMYRGAEVDIQVALHVEGDDPEPEHVLGPRDGFYLYDPHLGGTGAAQAIHRDGVELLLRLCRVYLERVLYHDRLRARYDLWADEEELMGRRRAGDDGDRQRDHAARKRALTWLDSRLRPEGSVSGGKRRGSYGVGSEEGEGDVIDIGRCWYSEDGTVTDLIWTKHRWVRDDGAEAMCDVGIGRKTAAGTRTYSADIPQLAEHLAWVEKQLDNPAFRLDDQTIWGRPNTVWSLDAGEEIPSGSDGNLLKDDKVLAFHRLVCAVACDSYPALGPLAELLAEHSRGATDTDEARFELARYLADFVQGIPFASNREPDTFFGPIHTLLYRLGNQQSQTLLLALMLRHVGIDAGMFLHPKTGRMLCAAALPETPNSGSDAAAGADELMAEAMVAWRERFGRVDQRLIWGELPPQPGATSKRLQVFVPIATDRHEALGVAQVDRPAEWVFLPLSAAWVRLGVERLQNPGGGVMKTETNTSGKLERSTRLPVTVTVAVTGLLRAMSSPSVRFSKDPPAGLRVCRINNPSSPGTAGHGHGHGHGSKRMPPPDLKLWVLASCMLLFVAGCGHDGPRKLAFPTFDARAPFPELSGTSAGKKHGSKAAKKGKSAFEKAIADSMNEGGAAKRSSKSAPGTVKRQKVPLPGGLASSIPLNFDEWQWSTSGDVTLVSHREAGAKEPDALIYAEGFSGLMNAFPSLEVRRFEHTVDPALSPPVVPQKISDTLLRGLSKRTGIVPGRLRDAFGRASSHTMGLGLNYSSSKDSFTGWQWVGHNDHDVAVRLGRTSGYWLTHPRADANAAGTLNTLAKQFHGMSGAAKRYQKIVAQQPAGSKRDGWSAWMLLGSAVVNKDVGAHIAIMCKTPCAPADELADFLADLAPADTAKLDALREQGSKASMSEFAGQQGLAYLPSRDMLPSANR